MTQAILLHAYDAGPSRAFTKIAQRLGNTSLLHVADGRDKQASEDDIATYVACANIVCIGISSERTCVSEQLAAILAHQQGKPVAIFADTFGAWRRKWIENLREKASLVFVASSSEVEATKSYFPNARIVASGNPIWDDYLLPQSEEGARERLGVEDDARVVLISGTKKEHVNVPMLEATLAAASRVPANPELRYVFAKHPGDRTDDAVYQSVFEQFPGAIMSFLGHGVRADEVVAGIAGLVHAGSSLLSVHCSIRSKGRIRVLDAPFDGLDAHVEQEVGGWNYTSHALGVSYRPSSLEDFALALSAIGEGHVDSVSCLPDDLVHLVPGEAANRIAIALSAL